MEALKSWKALNKALMNAGEPTAAKLFEAELKGQRRPAYLRRIHGRLNHLRVRRERAMYERKAAERISGNVGLRNRINKRKA